MSCQTGIQGKILLKVEFQYLAVFFQPGMKLYFEIRSFTALHEEGILSAPDFHAVTAQGIQS